MKTGDFYSAGKFLLSGEYLVMYGALSLAVPLKKGQLMRVIPVPEKPLIAWTTYVMEEEWFKADFQLPGLELIRSSDQKIAESLQRILVAGASVSPGYFNGDIGYTISSSLDFDIRWGLGSSSSLVSNLAWWLKADPFALFKKIFPGSGYDVFTARSKKPILFKLNGEIPEVSEVDFHPQFADKLYFVYLGKKQDSQDSVSRFRSGAVFNENDLKEASELTRQMVHADDIHGFMKVMERHEELLSVILKTEPAGRSIFAGFPGCVKSLGAWGGDFILAASEQPEDIIFKYFRSKGMDVIFRYDELAL